MSTSSKRRIRHSELQGKLFAAWDSLREKSLSSVREYNERRAATLAALDSEAVRLKESIAESQRVQGLLERKKFNLEATYLGRTTPYPDVSQTVEELLGVSLGCLGNFSPPEYTDEDLDSDLE